jgi:hypothetical protein
MIKVISSNKMAIELGYGLQEHVPHLYSLKCCEVGTMISRKSIESISKKLEAQI